MGLDMYLEAEEYLPGWEHTKDTERARLVATLEAAGFSPDVLAPGSPSATINVHVGYWRKANAIHRWFVEHVQGGKDDCDRYYVTREHLSELRETCVKALAASNGEVGKILPTQSGFFFGGTDYDESYRSDAESTIRQIDKALTLPKGVTFYYRASW